MLIQIGIFGRCWLLNSSVLVIVCCLVVGVGVGQFLSFVLGAIGSCCQVGLIYGCTKSVIKITLGVVLRMVGDRLSLDQPSQFM